MHRAPVTRLLCVLSLASLGVVGCSAGAADPDPVDLQAIRDTVIALESAMNTAVDSLDCATGLETLGDRQPLFVSSGYVVRTGEAVRSMCAQMVGARTGAHFQVDTLTANVLSNDAAFVVREGRYTVDLPNGISPTVYMVMTTIWQREQDGWKMVHLHESFLPPSPDSTAAK